MKIIIRVLILFAVITPTFAYSQSVTKGNTILNDEEKANYEKQARQLVSFMEFALNTLGSDKSEYKDKHTIIEQSYLKFFKDDKVQIEDDLVEKRDVVTNKDVQAYLKDIDFFFKNVTFKYTIEEVTQEINESGGVFFKIKASRNLKGKTIENKDINDNRTRYIEINLDGSSRDLKIVSVYTTKSNEVQELIAWWNDLDKGWRNFLAADSKITDTIYLRDVVVIHNDYIVKDILYTGYSDTLIDTDTIRINESKVLPEIRRILRMDEIDISEAKGIYDLKPLYAFTGLRYLNITNAKVPDLDPIRNLSKLETLLASKSLIDNLEPIRYIPQLRILDISGTLVSDISPIEALTSLEVLNLAESRVSDLKVLVNMQMLNILNISHTPSIRDISAISKLTSLQVLELSGLPVDSVSFFGSLSNLVRLVIEGTNITSLEGIESLSKLEMLFIDNTLVNSLEPLLKNPSLKFVYCDKTNIDSKKALSFMQLRPEVRVIYESLELMAWWEQLSDDWKQIYSGLITVTDPPTREQLHEISYIKTLDISNRPTITDLSPISELSSLRNLNLSGTGIKDLNPLVNLFDLQSLNISHTRISDLMPLSGLSTLTEIDFSETAVISLKPVVELSNLRTLGMDSTNVTDTELLVKMRHLNTVYADGVVSLPANVSKITDSIADVLIIYQTKILNDWWNGLSPVWKSIFTSYEPVSQVPDRVQLHKISSLKQLDISNRKEISDLTPLSTLKRLESLNASNLQLADISPLIHIGRLKMIDISNTPVADLQPLSNNKLLEELNCANSQINDLSPLSLMTSLRSLNISGTQVTKLDPLKTCTGLEELVCYNTRINSLKPLEANQKIKLLRAYNTRLSERKIEKFKELHPQAEVVFY